MPLFEKYPNLYTDISSLTQINKLGFLVRALDNPRLVERMVFGTDWPLQFFPLVSPWYQIKHVLPGELKAIQRIDNQWDRDVALKRVGEMLQEVFENVRINFYTSGHYPAPPPIVKQAGEECDVVIGATAD